MKVGLFSSTKGIIKATVRKRLLLLGSRVLIGNGMQVVVL